jgi:hypothetical protein
LVWVGVVCGAPISLRGKGLGFRFWVLGFRLSGSGFRVQGLRCWFRV